MLPCRQPALVGLRQRAWQNASHRSTGYVYELMPNTSPAFSRAIGVLVGGIAVGLGLRVVTWLTPAIRPLVWPLYWIVAAIVLVALWHVTRPRAGKDRRQDDRRQD